MKNSNFDRLIQRYITQKTSANERIKIEAMLNAIGRRKIHLLSKQTEEFLFRKITDENSSVNDIVLAIKSFSKLTVSSINWLGMEEIQVYFHKGII